MATCAACVCYTVEEQFCFVYGADRRNRVSRKAGETLPGVLSPGGLNPPDLWKEVVGEIFRALRGSVVADACLWGPASSLSKGKRSVYSLEKEAGGLRGKHLPGGYSGRLTHISACLQNS